MPLQPSRRDILGPPPRDVSDLASVVRHQGSYLRSLDPGITDGRLATPRPPKSGPTLLVGGDEGGGGEAENVIGEDGDRLTLANLATQVWTLSYTPISETLVVRFHPGAGAGVEWKRGEHYDLAEDDQIVTIYSTALTSGRAEVGDVFSAQYLRIDGEEEDPTVPPAPVTATIRGVRSGHYGSSGLPTTFALPAGTVVGDLIAVSTNGSVTDGRVTQVGGIGVLWVGFATTLADLAVDMTGVSAGRWSIACMTLDTNAVGWDTAVTSVDLAMSVGELKAIPQIPAATAVICAIYSTHAIVDGSTSPPTGYTTGSSSGNAKVNNRLDLWTSVAEDLSPAGPAVFNGGSGLCDVAVLSLIGP